MIWRARFWRGDNLVRVVDFPCNESCGVSEALDAALPNPPEHDALTVSPRSEE